MNSASHWERSDEALAEALIRFVARQQGSRLQLPAEPIVVPDSEGEEAEALSPLMQTVWWLRQDRDRP